MMPMMLMMMMMIQMLSVSAVVIANLCVSYVVTNQRESVSSSLLCVIRLGLPHF